MKPDAGTGCRPLNAEAVCSHGSDFICTILYLDP